MMRSIPDQPPLSAPKMQNEMSRYESVEEIDSVRSASLNGSMPVRRRAELVAVLSWRLVCACMILGDVRHG